MIGHVFLFIFTVITLLFYIKDAKFRHVVNLILLYILKIPISILEYMENHWGSKDYKAPYKTEPQKQTKNNLPDFENMSIDDREKWFANHRELVSSNKSIPRG